MSARNVDQGTLVKIDAEIFRGGLLFRDPRRKGTASDWVCLPVWDGDGITRGDERNVVKTHVSGSKTDRATTATLTLDAGEREALSRLVGSSGVSDVAEGNYARPLHHVLGLRAKAEEAIAGIVRAARADGVSWSGIGELLGTSKQAAQQRYGKPAMTPTLDPSLPPPLDL